MYEAARRWPRPRPTKLSQARSGISQGPGGRTNSAIVGVGCVGLRWVALGCFARASGPFG
jgi:hypothetical protein